MHAKLRSNATIWLRATSVVAMAFVFQGCPDDTGPNTGLDASRDAGRADVRAVDASDAPRVPSPVLLAVVPSHGSFLGGTAAALRGTNFAEDSVVRFGGSLVQPRYTEFADSHRINVATPAGNPGDVDVTIESNGVLSTLPHGYHYDSFYVDPPSGPTTGNARVSIHGSGTHFADGMSISFDGMPCTMVTVTSPELVSCLTPGHPDGRVPVRVVSGSESITVEDGYTYSDNSDTVGAGLAGGALRTSLTVLVLDAMTGGPVPSAFVFLNNEPGAIPPNAGQTNERGQVTLSPPRIMPPVTVTASKHCYTTTTIQSFNAATATVYLTPLMLPGCGMGSPSGMPQRPVYPARIEGELIWDGPNEFAPNAWNNIPAPRMGERRVAKVFVSRPDIYTQDPSAMDAMALTATVYEAVEPGYGGRGYPYRLQARPASVAVYALAGIEVNATRRFTPYLMGVARSVLGSPRATVTNVNINMNIPLDHEMQMVVDELPMQTNGQPNVVTGAVFIDLGGEGVIPRPDLTVTGTGTSSSYRFSGLPAFSGTLADARLTVHARYTSGMVTGPRPFQDAPAPMSGLIIQGITTPDDTLHVRNWLGIPDIMTPTAGGRLPTDRTVRFGVMGPSPDLMIMNLTWDGGSWQHLAPGAERAIQYPDLSTLMGLQDLPSGSSLGLSLVGVRIPGFDFNRFTYATIGAAYWTAYSGRGVPISR